MKAAERNRTARLAGRRAFLRAVAGIAAFAVGAKDFLWARSSQAQTNPPGFPLPDEPVDATLKRLFGNRGFQRGEDNIKLELPQIAEDGGNVAVSIDTNLPVSGTARVNHIYIISDKNRRPMLARFSFSENSGRASIATSVRLATSTDVRAIVEMSDGTLYAVSKPVRVTISGCDLPPSG
jgi:predicted secreted protein